MPVVKRALKKASKIRNPWKYSGKGQTEQWTQILARSQSVSYLRLCFSLQPFIANLLATLLVVVISILYTFTLLIWQWILCCSHSYYTFYTVRIIVQRSIPLNNSTPTPRTIDNIHMLGQDITLTPGQICKSINFNWELLY